MSEHTPGPWHLCSHMAGTDADCTCGYLGDVSAEGGPVVAFLGVPHRGEDDGCGCSMLPYVDDEPTRQANARLIAAAPDLLTVALTLAEWTDPNGDRHCVSCLATGDPDFRIPMPHEDWCALGEVIAKARGELVPS